MSPDRNRLHIAIQKSGRLSDLSRQLLKDAGLKLSEGGKNHLTARAENFPLDLMFVRDDDIPTFVADGICELGIVGQNVLQEHMLGLPEPRVEEIARLGFGRCSLKIAAPETLTDFDVAMLDGQRCFVMTEGDFAQARRDHGPQRELCQPVSKKRAGDPRGRMAGPQRAACSAAAFTSARAIRRMTGAMVPKFWPNIPG